MNRLNDQDFNRAKINPAKKNGTSKSKETLQKFNKVLISLFSFLSFVEKDCSNSSCKGLEMILYKQNDREVLNDPNQEGHVLTQVYQMILKSNIQIGINDRQILIKALILCNNLVW